MIKYISDIEEIAASQLEGFFVGWEKPLDKTQHYTLLKDSTHFIVAVDSNSNKVVGFITALSDGAVSAFIPLLEVIPEFQGKSIGSELFTRMQEILNNVLNIDLICAPKTQSYYERFGMSKASGMIIRKD